MDRDGDRDRDRLMVRLRERVRVLDIHRNWESLLSLFSYIFSCSFCLETVPLVPKLS
jgi:hypothetical protein